MGLFRKIIFLFLSIILPTAILSYFPDNERNRLFYLMHTSDIETALSYYQDLKEKTNAHDFEALQHLTNILLKRGVNEADMSAQQLTLFGANISASTNALPIIEIALTSSFPEVQLMALHCLKDIYDDSVYETLLKCMTSDYLIIRMEAAFLMAIKKHPSALGQIESLMNKLPPMFRPFFPTLFMHLGTPGAISMIKSLLNDPYTPVRVEAILSISHFQKDELLPLIRRKISCANVAEQEACAYTLGQLKDTSSMQVLQKLTQTSTINVRLASAKSLYLLSNNPDYKKFIMDNAKEGNLFAITLLSEIEGSEDLLYKLCFSENISVRINAAISLLHRKDPRCCITLLEAIITDTRDLLLQPSFSLGRSMMCWKVVPSSSLRTKDPTIDPSVGLHIKEFLLQQTIDLPESNFINLAEQIIIHKQNDLIPLLVTLLENIHSPNAIGLLKKYSQATGSPLIRDYCHLALFRLKEEGPYENYITSWVEQQRNVELIRLRPLLPLSSRLSNNNYQLSAEERSRLLIEMYMSLAQRQDERFIDTLIEAIKEGKSNNRYALAGLLLRAIE